MKKILLFMLVLAVIGGVFYFLNKKEAIAPVTILPTSTDVITDKNANTQGELCFAKFGMPDQNGSYDKYTLRLVLNGDKATGELNLLPAETDSKTGEFEGTVSAMDKMSMSRTADLWWYALAEGMSTQEELKIIFGEGTASIDSFNLNLTDVACSDLVERGNVEDYLHENISTLSPVSAVLGGTWYVISSTVDTVKNSGTVWYEDGHTEERKNFSYTTDAGGKVKSLTIIDSQ